MKYPYTKPDDFSLSISDRKMNAQNRPPNRVGIVGTGRFAAALTNRLLCSGYDVTIGSRQPEMRNLLVDHCFCNFNITSIPECLEKCDIIILAIHAENYKDTLFQYRGKIDSKILVDVSNRLARAKDESYAEYLASLFPSARVVKAFNTIPAWDMKRNTFREDYRVLIAGSDMDAKQYVSRLAVNMGFHPVDTGSLKSARMIEDYNLRMFPEWRSAAFVAVGIFNVWLVYVLLMIFAEKRTESWNQLFLKVFNKPLCLTAITLMAIAQISKPLGNLLRSVVKGNRKSPNWFKRWVSAKTQLGVLSWILMGMHVLMSVMLTNNTYFPALYEQLDQNSRCNITNQVSSTRTVSEWMNWKGEAGLLLGLLALVACCVVGFSSVSTIRNSLNWREKRFTQSTLNSAGLFFVVCHVVMTAIADWTSNVVWPFYHSTSFLCIILPSFAILLGIVASCPCISNSVKKLPTGVHFYDVGKTCQCHADSRGNANMPMESELTIYHEMQRLSDRVGYKTLVDEEF